LLFRKRRRASRMSSRPSHTFSLGQYTKTDPCKVIRALHAHVIKQIRTSGRRNIQRCCR
jgi:hypothetical protein